MDLSDLRTELQDRGFSDLTTARANRYINYGNQELDRYALWEWLESSVTGTAPLSIPTLAQIEAVTNETQDYRLKGAQWRDLLDWYGDLSTTGTPEFYYRAAPSQTPAVAVYPANTSDTIGVQFWRTTPLLSADDDEPLSPDEAHYLIVDLAVRRAYRDRDNHSAAEAIQSEIDRQLDGLVKRFATGVADDPGHIVPGYWGW